MHWNLMHDFETVKHAYFVHITKKIAEYRNYFLFKRHLELLPL